MVAGAQRRIDGREGEFLGVAFATILIAAIGEFFSKVDLGLSGVVTRDPRPGAGGSRAGGRSPRVRRHQPQHCAVRARADRREPGIGDHLMRAVSEVDGIDRHYAYRRLQHRRSGSASRRRPADSAGAWRRTAASLALVLVAVSSFFRYGRAPAGA
ncbi:MAG: hypothetical protein MZW92_07275 [Comamonadaceae bacterium]|nr:hypothetical protein [Comamonadaceae bacterium]